MFFFVKILYKLILVLLLNCCPAVFEVTVKYPYGGDKGGLTKINFSFKLLDCDDL